MALHGLGAVVGPGRYGVGIFDERAAAQRGHRVQGAKDDSPVRKKRAERSNERASLRS